MSSIFYGFVFMAAIYAQRRVQPLVGWNDLLCEIFFIIGIRFMKTANFWMSIYISPYPQRDTEINFSEVESQLTGLVDNPSTNEAINDTTCSSKSSGIGLLLNVTSEDIRFFWGKPSESSNYIPFHKPIIYRFLCPCFDSKRKIGNDKSNGENQHYTEVRLELIPKIEQTDIREDIIRSKQQNSRKNTKWQDIFWVFYDKFRELF